jgi:hypothetical protein
MAVLVPCRCAGAPSRGITLLARDAAGQAMNRKHVSPWQRRAKWIVVLPVFMVCAVVMIAGAVCEFIVDELSDWRQR